LPGQQQQQQQQDQLQPQQQCWQVVCLWTADTVVDLAMHHAASTAHKQVNKPSQQQQQVVECKLDPVDVTIDAVSTVLCCFLSLQQ
jgi:hypothetical protein